MTKHDIQQVQETQELIKGIGEISDKAFQIYTHSEREKIEQAKLELGKYQAQNASKEEIGKLAADLDRLQRDYDKAYGTGSPTKRAVDAVTAALQGLAAKDAGQAAVGLASPYLNEQIKLHTLNADGSVNTEANLIAHALLGAVEAAATGNNLLAGAGSEAAANFIVNTLYKGKSTKELSESEKQTVTFLSQLAGGLALGIIGDSTQSAAVGADIGKRAVENNQLAQILNNPTFDWQSMALGQQAKSDIEKNITEYVKKEQPIIYQTVEGTYYFLSTTGKAVYLTREIVLDIAPLLIAPEVTAGTKAFVWTSRAALGAGANVASQKLSGQDFNTVEMVGATVSSVVTPSLKTAKDVVRFNAGVGMATGLASGGDGLLEGGLAGSGSYIGKKIPNPVMSSAVSEFIQKVPTITETIFEQNIEEGENK